MKEPIAIGLIKQEIIFFIERLTIPERILVKLKAKEIKPIIVPAVFVFLNKVLRAKEIVQQLMPYKNIDKNKMIILQLLKVLVK